MTIFSDDEGAGKVGAERCAECGAGLSPAQRYCLRCGSRCGPLPSMIAKRIDALRKRGLPLGSESGIGVAAAAATAAATEDGEASEKSDRWDFMPSPQVAAVAVMALLAAGVVLGSVTSPLAESAGVSSIILEEMGGSEPAESAPEPVAATPSVAPEPAALAPVAEAPLAVPLEEPAAEPEPAPAALPPELPEEETLPEINHVFLIVLDGHGYEEAFGEASTAPYLAKTLAGEGKLLSNYYSVAQGGLANEIALVSGQGPTPQTAVGCPEYTAIAPGTVNPEGQVEGGGCIYPPTTETLPSQLTTAELTWKAYVEDIANGEAAGQPTTCRHPALASPDASPAPVPGDAFVTWRNPFVYFGGLTESPECAERDVGLDRLVPDLQKAEKTPSFSYIVPNACHDGSENPCAPEQPAGLLPVDGFLETVIPEITASPAYEEDGGLIAITFDQAPQSGPTPDSSSCCATPEYPNLPAPAAAPADAEPAATGPVKPTGGGGQVGMLLLSPYVAPGSIDESGYYNHFSFLRSVEELFELEPLGYAADPALTGFDSSVYDSSPEESTVSPSPRPTQARPSR